MNWRNSARGIQKHTGHKYQVCLNWCKHQNDELFARKSADTSKTFPEHALALWDELAELGDPFDKTLQMGSITGSHG